MTSKSSEAATSSFKTDRSRASLSSGSEALVFGHATFSRVWTSGVLLVVGALGMFGSISALRTRIEVFPDRLRVVRGLSRARVIHPNELQRFFAKGKGNVVIHERTARRRGFTTNRFHRGYENLVAWLEQNASEPWAEFTDFFGKLTVRKQPQPVRDVLSMLLVVGFVITTLLMFPGLWLGISYDDAHKEQVVCTITAAEPITISTRSTRGIGSSHAGVRIETPDCGRLTFDKGVFWDNRDAIARRYDRSPGPYTLTVGGGSFWFRENTPWLWPVPSPTVYSIDGPAHA